MADETNPDWAYEMQALRDESEQTVTELRRRIVQWHGSWLKTSQALTETKAELREARRENARLRRSQLPTDDADGQAEPVESQRGLKSEHPPPDGHQRNGTVPTRDTGVSS